MKNFENLILLSKNSHRGIINSSIEMPLESIGYLIGIKKENKYYISDIYTIQTAIRTPTMVLYGNEQSIKRLRAGMFRRATPQAEKACSQPSIWRAGFFCRGVAGSCR